FERWNEVIKDKILVAALIDRITQKAYLVNMNGDSYRLKQTKLLNKK
ncbi:ATP-binding protein, partial [Bacteroides graminisolvens]